MLYTLVILFQRTLSCDIKMIKFDVKMSDNAKARTTVIDKYKKVLMKSMFKMEELAQNKAPFDRGFLRANITLFPQILAGKYVLISKAPYSADLEYGNTPKKVLFEDIEEWVRRKGIRTTEDNIYVFTKYVVEKIRREGVNQNPFMRPALHEVETFWLPQYFNEEFGT